MATMTAPNKTPAGIPVRNNRNGGPPENAEQVRVELWHVTPELSADWLDKNERNRPEKYSGQARYIRDIADGRWMVNGEAIKFGWDGNLIDGQNRLQACIEADRGFWTLVMFDLDPDCFKTLDTGVKRSFGDILSLLGYKNATLLAAAVAELWRYEQGLAGQTGVSAHGNNDELLETLARHEGLIHSVWAGDAVKNIIPRPSQAIFCHYVFAGKDKPLADWFYSALGSGAGLQETDALLHLRNRLMREHLEQGTPDRRWQLAMTVKAWNAHRKGVETKLLRWGETEAFPEIE